ncbi:MAG: S1 RNA-binding domain-containing protein, partial [Selenomonadales bacterium]|nr:S1 RNA-binding domain-containing protein [Selenomonadales bacterium]
GTVVVGTVAKLTNFGAFVKIADGLEGLVRMAEISERHIKKAEEALSVGQEVKVKVLTIDKRNKKIALSIRQVQQDAERAEYKAYMKEQEDKNVAFGNQLGDLLKDFEV